jgi:hypothetical protein
MVLWTNGFQSRDPETENLVTEGKTKRDGTRKSSVFDFRTTMLLRETNSLVRSCCAVQQVKYTSLLFGYIRLITYAYYVIKLNSVEKRSGFILTHGLFQWYAFNNSRSVELKTLKTVELLKKYCSDFIQTRSCKHIWVRACRCARAFVRNLD